MGYFQTKLCLLKSIKVVKSNALHIILTIAKTQSIFKYNVYVFTCMYALVTEINNKYNNYP